VNRISFWLEIKILLKTIFKVMKREGIVSEDFVGSGGHASVVLDAAKQMNRWETYIVLDENANGVVLTVDDLYQQRLKYKDSSDFFVAIGDNPVRKRMLEELTLEEFSLATIIHPSAVVAPSVVIEEGSCVFVGAVLNPFVQIGKGVIINTSASIDHHSSIGSFTHICPGAVLADNVKVGESCFVGTGTVISNQIDITNEVTLFAGAVVVKSIEEAGIYVGVPARKI
jgi:sugar O-acyltransferase (sialic acid O-acetyltransferase NeuD family)